MKPNNIHIVYGPPMSGKTLNAPAIAELLGCDITLDWNEQFLIRKAQREHPDKKILVLALERKPAEFRGYRGMFDGAKRNWIETIKDMLGAKFTNPQPQLQ